MLHAPVARAQQVVYAHCTHTVAVHYPKLGATARPLSSQNLMLNSCIIGGVAAGGACALGYLEPDSLVQKLWREVVEKQARRSAPTAMLGQAKQVPSQSHHVAHVLAWGQASLPDMAQA